MLQWQFQKIFEENFQNLYRNVTTNGSSIQCERKIFQKTNISYPLVRTRTCLLRLMFKKNHLTCNSRIQEIKLNIFKVFRAATFQSFSKQVIFESSIHFYVPQDSYITITEIQDFTITLLTVSKLFVAVILTTISSPLINSLSPSLLL